MPVLTHTYGQATLTSSGIGGAALVSVSNAATVTPVALAAPYPSDALYPSDSLFPDSTYLPVGLGVATLAPQPVAAAQIQLT